MIAAYVGSCRNVQAITNGWQSPNGATDKDMWTFHVEGAAGEMATAKFLGVYYEPIVGNPDADDVRRWQVRTNNSRKWEDTVLRPRDNPDKIYIGVLSFSPEYEVMGWILGKDGKRTDWLRPGDLERPDCYFVPRKALLPMVSLPGRFS